MSEQSQVSIADGFRLFGDIAFFRKGPEDLPVSVKLLAFAVAGVVLLRAALLAIVPAEAEGNPAVVIGAGVLVALLFTNFILRLARRPERYLQTATALFGYQLVMAPALVFTGWLFLTYGTDPAWQLPAAGLRLAVEVWALAVAGRILRSATDWPLFACVALAIANEILTFLVILALVPQAQAAPAGV